MRYCPRSGSEDLSACAVRGVSKYRRSLLLSLIFGPDQMITTAWKAKPWARIEKEYRRSLILALALTGVRYSALAEALAMALAINLGPVTSLLFVFKYVAPDCALKR